jgi:hypothetical protein
MVKLCLFGLAVVINLAGVNIQGIRLDDMDPAETVEPAVGLVKIGTVTGEDQVLVLHPYIAEQTLDPFADGFVILNDFSLEIDNLGFLRPGGQGATQQENCAGEKFRPASHE